MSGTVCGCDKPSRVLSPVVSVGRGNSALNSRIREPVQLTGVTPEADKPKRISAREAVEVGQRVINFPVIGIILAFCLGARVVINRHHPLGGLALIVAARRSSSR